MTCPVLLQKASNKRMDDCTQIYGNNSSLTTSYGGVLPRNVTGSVVQSFTNGSPVNDGIRKLDKAPLMTDPETRLSCGTTQMYTEERPCLHSVDFVNAAKPNGLSTLSGVFAPVAISMFSVLLFLRMGFVIGQLGFLQTVAQLFLAYGIVMLTVLSLCAISSNGAVEGGGVYYMISRSLGPEFGGAIGLLFYTANVFSCALYVTGFAEALLNNIGEENFPSSTSWKFLFCVLVSFVLLLLCLLGAGLFAKTALITFSVISICYVTFLLSVFIIAPFDVPIPKTNEIAYLVPLNLSDPSSEKVPDFNQTLNTPYTGFRFATLINNMMTNYTFDYTTSKPTDFALMFSIIFSGITGLMAGANMSGELARPSVSIPRGTVQAVFVTLIVYITTAFFTAATCSRELLQSNYSVMMNVNISPLCILIGIFSTTFFSSMSNMIGASRVLNRVAHDKLFGYLFHLAKIEISGGNPVAPTFKYFTWHTCAVGVVSTIIMMLVIDTAMSAIGVIAPVGSWGSISQALIYHQVRKYLLLLDVRKEHVKYWRPQILLLVSRPGSVCPLMDFINDLKKVFPYWLSLVDYLKLKAFVEITISKSVREGIQQLMRLSGLGAMKPNTVVLGFHEKSPAESTLVESCLLKDIRFSRIDRAAVVEYFTASDYMPREPNSSRERLNSDEYVRILNDVIHINKNLCVARNFSQLNKDVPRGWNGQKKFIDVWPVFIQKPGETGLGWGNSSLFLLQMACILSMSTWWRSSSILRVFICVNSLQDMQRRERQLEQMLAHLRINAKSLVTPWDHVVCHLGDDNPSAPLRESVDLPLPYLIALNDLIKSNSGDATVCLLNLPTPPKDVIFCITLKHNDSGHRISCSEQYLEVIRHLTDGLPPTLLVHGLSLELIGFLDLSFIQEHSIQYLLASLLYMVLLWRSQYSDVSLTFIKLLKSMDFGKLLLLVKATLFWSKAKVENNSKNIVITTGSGVNYLPKINVDEKNIISSIGASSITEATRKLIVIESEQ
ncbi:Solute carrier family 12 member 9 [Dirofilaria immitis]|nr:Solute carrier family 12 member 9 [Dirofilaria immitis]